MTDRISKTSRSSLMSKIRSKNTKCEIALFSAIESLGIKNYARHYNIIGKPDLAFPKKKLAVFCDSDFWHGKKNTPKSNADYWIKKLERNRKRDKLVNLELKKQGWRIVRISEQSILKKPLFQARRIQKMLLAT